MQYSLCKQTWLWGLRMDGARLGTGEGTGHPYPDSFPSQTRAGSDRDGVGVLGVGGLCSE